MTGIVNLLSGSKISSGDFSGTGTKGIPLTCALSPNRSYQESHDKKTIFGKSFAPKIVKLEAAMEIVEVESIREAYQPAEEYSKLNNEDLIIRYVEHYWRLLRYVEAVLDHYEKSTSSEDRCIQNHRICSSPKDDDWLALYRLSSNKRLVQQLIWWHCAIRKIEDEMAFRLRDKPVANLILDLEASKFSSSEIDPYLASRILKLLIRSQDRKSYRPTDYGSDDIQSEVILI